MLRGVHKPLQVVFGVSSSQLVSWDFWAPSDDWLIAPCRPCPNIRHKAEITRKPWKIGMPRERKNNLEFIPTSHHSLSRPSWFAFFESTLLSLWFNLLSPWGIHSSVLLKSPDLFIMDNLKNREITWIWAKKPGKHTNLEETSYDSEKGLGVSSIPGNAVWQIGFVPGARKNKSTWNEKYDHQSTTIIASEQVLLRVRISYIYIYILYIMCRIACLRNVSGECQLTEVSGCQPNMWESPKVRNFPVTKWFLGPAPLIALKAGSIGRLCVCVAT